MDVNKLKLNDYFLWKSNIYWKIGKIIKISHREIQFHKVKSFIIENVVAKYNDKGQEEMNNAYASSWNSEYSKGPFNPNELIREIFIAWSK